MIFNDPVFLFLFLPVVVLGFSAVPPAARQAWLLAASLLFYGLSGLEHVIVLLGCVTWVWAFTRSQRIIGNRLLFALAVAGPATALIYYKYLTFLLVHVLALPPEWPRLLGASADKLLPAGISFFTFHLVSFAFDRYHGKLETQPEAGRFGLYICFFPHLVAGPILRFSDISAAMTNLPRFRLSRSDLSKAFGYIVFGLAAKVLIADTLSDQLTPFAHHPGGLDQTSAMYVMLAYSFQIYFDFYGYSLMAMGLAFLFGFSFPMNFNRPYESLNPQDFWRRWHMTLGNWIRDYLYIPLGGNHAFARNILIVFALCGLWHGAAWQFVVWGLYHGALIVAHHRCRSFWDALPVLAQRIITFALVSLGWVLFLFDFQQALDFGRSLAGLNAGQSAGPDSLAWAILAAAAIACFVIRPERWADDAKAGMVGLWLRSAGFAGLIVAALLLIDRSKTFIYFRF